MLMIYLVRHGQTDWNVVKRLMGQTNIPLNDFGRVQAQSLGKEISELKIDQIFSSDLQRTRETAEIVNKFFNADISLDNRLREINYGDIEGRLKETIKEYWNLFNAHPEQFNAESLESVYNRIKSFFEDLAKKDLSNVLIVTHGGTLRMIMYYAKNRNSFNKEDYIIYDFISLKKNFEEEYYRSLFLEVVLLFNDEKEKNNFNSYIKNNFKYVYDDIKKEMKDTNVYDVESTEEKKIIQERIATAKVLKRWQNKMLTEE
jgi:broad specificity phosphatase PhoE